MTTNSTNLLNQSDPFNPTNPQTAPLIPTISPYDKDVCLGAAETIREICQSNLSCDSCPYFSPTASSCLITATKPKDWVTSEEGQVWRALI